MLPRAYDTHDNNEPRKYRPVKCRPVPLKLAKLAKLAKQLEALDFGSSREKSSLRVVFSFSVAARLNRIGRVAGALNYFLLPWPLGGRRDAFTKKRARPFSAYPVYTDAGTHATRDTSCQQTGTHSMHNVQVSRVPCAAPSERACADLASSRTHESKQFNLSDQQRADHL